MKLGHCYLAPFFHAEAEIGGQRAAVRNLWDALFSFGFSPYTHSIRVHHLSATC